MPPEENSQKPPVFESVIPEEFRDRPYLSDLKSLPVGPDAYKALFSKLDGSQKLIGKKAGIPEASAPQEEWDSFHAKLRPATAEEYETKGAEADPEFAKAVKGMFFEAGLSKGQATKLQAKFDAFITEKTAAQVAESARLDKEFEQLTSAAFGSENKTVLDQGKAMLTELVPDNLKPHLARLPNESLVLLAAVMASVRAKYIKEGGAQGEKGGGGAPTDEAALRDEARKLMALPEYKDFRHASHENTKRRVDEIYQTIGTARKK